jgi:CelD/BcsL family acetyltransferase involved in cellulose biosynthesis
MASSFWVEHPVPVWLNAPAKLDHAWQGDRSARARWRAQTGAQTAAPFGEAPLIVESFGFETAAAIVGAWSDLIGRSLEPNVFMEPGFALSAAQHFARAERPTFVAVWEGGPAGGRGRLIGLWALILPSGRFGSQVARLWCHKQSALGLPLMDGDRADAVVAAVFAWLGETRPRLRGIVIPKLVRSGPTFARFLSHALGAGLEWRLLDQYERAVLHAHGRAASGESAIASTLPAIRRKNVRRQRRRLEDHGAVSLRSAHRPDEVRNMTEAFLAMEERGWKGTRRTALLSDCSHAAFARTMTRRMAAEGKCRIDALSVGERPVAIAIVLESGDRAFFWKTAYDEEFAAHSPGLHLAVELTGVQQAQTRCSMTDSCAIADHPMIDRIWHDRLPIVDLALSLSPAGNDALIAFVRRDRLMRRVRQGAADRVRAARGWKRS